MLLNIGMRGRARPAVFVAKATNRARVARQIPQTPDTRQKYIRTQPRIQFLPAVLMIESKAQQLAEERRGDAIQWSSVMGMCRPTSRHPISSLYKLEQDSDPTTVRLKSPYESLTTKPIRL